MAAKSKAVALAGAHGSEVHSTGVEYCPFEDRQTQRVVLLRHLRRYGSISTLEARLRYFIMSPASRVFELRRRGHSIQTERDPQQRCARYHLTDPADSGGGGDA